MTLSIEQEIAVARTAVAGHEISTYARTGDFGGLRGALMGGSSPIGGFFSCKRKAVEGRFDSALDTDTPDWTITWKRLGEIIDAGLSIGAIAALGEADTRWRHLHGSVWSCRYSPESLYPCCGHCRSHPNAVHDAVAYDLLWMPEYSRCHDLWRAAAEDVWAQALDVLITERQLVEEQLVLL